MSWRSNRSRPIPSSRCPRRPRRASDRAGAGEEPSVSASPTMSGSLWHRFTLGSGPLKRSTDRIQVLARILLVVAALTAVPFALAVATATDSSLRTMAGSQAANRHQVDATLVEEPVAPMSKPPEQAVLTA